MTKAEHVRLVAWRSKFLQHAAGETRGVAARPGDRRALAGWIGPIQAALLHLGPDVLVFLNSVKLLRVSLEAQPA